MRHSSHCFPTPCSYSISSHRVSILLPEILSFIPDVSLQLPRRSFAGILCGKGMLLFRHEPHLLPAPMAFLRYHHLHGCGAPGEGRRGGSMLRDRKGVGRGHDVSVASSEKARHFRVFQGQFFRRPFWSGRKDIASSKNHIF